MIRKNIFAALFITTCRLATAKTPVTQDIDLAVVSEKQVEIVDISNADLPGKTFIAATVMNGSVQKICSVIMNYQEYPQFMPNTEKTNVVSISDDATLIELTLGLPLGKTKKYRLKMTSAISPESCQLAWKLVPWEGLQVSETITDTTGYWQLTPYTKDKSKTLVKYYVFADPGPIPYGLGWIVEVLSKFSLPRTLDALRERVTIK